MRTKISSCLLCTIFMTAASAIGQTCTGSLPPSNGQAWGISLGQTVYIDPTLPDAIKSAISSAANDFASQTGQLITVSASGSTDPGVSQQGAIRFLNNPSGSTSAFAHTDTTLKGNNPSQQVSATTSFNTGYMLDPTTPAYIPAGSPGGDNAAQYLYDVVLHELGHAYGLADSPVPTDSSGNQNYALQPAGASIMNGSVNTNDQGPHLDPATGNVVNGGIGATAVQPCDKQQIASRNPPNSGGGGSGSKGGHTVPVDSPPPDGGGGGGSSDGGGGGGSCYWEEEWDDTTNSLTDTYVC